VFNLVWNFLPVGPAQMLEFLANEFDFDVSQNTVNLIYSLSPTGAYMNSMKLIMPDQFIRGVGGMVTDLPFYLEGWFMVVIMAAWVVVPTVLGAWQFRRAELG
jgi:ABC-2 type transport system permease protein